MLIKKYIVIPFCLLVTTSSLAQLPQDFVIPVKTVVNEQQPAITLTWPVNAGASSYSIKRKTVTGSSYNIAFTNIASFNTRADTVTTFTDAGIIPGILYEYEISGDFPSLLPSSRNNYLCAGINVIHEYNRGAIILVCDNTIIAAIEPELKTLYTDLIADGWKVHRIDVNRSSSPADAPGVRNKIIEAYNKIPGTKQVLIIGHVAVPYSGGFNPDGHSNHYGAWPADGYYGDMVNTNWTDNITAGTPTTTLFDNLNNPGDGKFDQNDFTSVQLAVGRIDFANMPALGLGETDLLKRYFVKNHQYRIGAVNIKKRALIEDNLAAFAEKFSQASWKSFAATVGLDNVKSSHYETELLASDGYLWSYGTGAGSFTSCSGIGTTTDFAANAYKTVFTELFGSYFGDWNTQDNLLRASVAAPGNTLACVWGGRPHWYFHHTAAGYPIGYSVLLTMNNKDIYYNPGNQNAKVHIALMGDPSLRTDYIQPASELKAAVNKTTIELTWNATPAVGVNGYNIYRSNSITGEFIQLNNELVLQTTFTDYAPPIGNNVYMVRAAKKETFVSTGTYNNNSTYTNLSQGIIDSVLFSNIVLPVKFELFNARINNCKTELTWKPVEEAAVKEYEVEYSSTGSNFITVGQTAALNNSHTYSFAHSPATGKAFYRLKIKGVDGKYEYSKVIVLPVKCGSNSALVFPNPVKDILNVNVTLQSNTSLNKITLFDAAGKTLYENKITNGANTVDMSRFAKGIYHLKLTTGYAMQNFKIQK